MNATATFTMYGISPVEQIIIKAQFPNGGTFYGDATGKIALAVPYFPMFMTDKIRDTNKDSITL